ncbi:TPA: Tn3 family transposase [Enterobacter hormaechei subsp. steigerwaltii]|nr:Tn3 family transposase [Enterobacter hormaechei subsp. steigerwaltii]HAV1480345.1 Tn3 family transposase [Enterobacter hormaechei subsp. steigerwaltii]
MLVLDWFRESAPRWRVLEGLNKRETQNVLARALFLHRLDEIRDCRIIFDIQAAPK